MMDSEKEKEKNLRLALEETNRWHRQIDNYTWAIGSVFLFFTVFAFKESYYLIIKGKLEVFLIFLLMVILWELYIKFLKRIVLQVQYFIERSNDIESELGIDVIPYNKSNKNKKEDEKISSVIFGDFVKGKLEKKRSQPFIEVMLHIKKYIYIVILVSSLLFLVYSADWIYDLFS